MTNTKLNGKKYYFVQFNFDDPYPKSHEVRSQQGSSIGRAVDLAYKDFKKTRPGKREPKMLKITVLKLA